VTVLEVTRFSLSDLKEITVTCKACGAKMVFPLDGENCLIASECYVCKELLGPLDKRIYLHDLVKAINDLKESKKVNIEFELVIS
jgi:hypothetical protein